MQVQKRNYIEPGKVKSLLHYFCVPKGLSYIIMVYNGTGCVLNKAVWASYFGLPTVRQTLRSLLPGYQQCDMDVGAMLFNFLFHEELKQLSGVEVTNVRSEEGPDTNWEAQRPQNGERWCWNWMGLRDSPYQSIQHMI